MFNLKNLLSQYELLVITASHLSTVDLYRVALTCSELQELILKPRETFNGLKRYALCDGAGIKARQNYRLPRPDWYDPCPETEIEVHIFNLECDNTERLPCIKCGINVCEECRSYPRLGDGYGPCRLPHYSVNGELENVICYCDKCDREVEKKFGGELCKCDRYARWICKFCEWKESEEVSWYCDRTKLGEIDEEGMAIFDHQCWKLFWCPCGVRAPVLGNIRCIWCKRKHKTRIVEEYNEWGPRRRELTFDDPTGFWHPFE